MVERKAKEAFWAGEKFWGCTYDLVPIPGMFGSNRCSKRAKYDPDADGNPTKCGIHCDAATAKRRAKSNAKLKATLAGFERRDAQQSLMREATQIVRRIADGHNDPRSMALDWVSRMDATKPEEDV